MSIRNVFFTFFGWPAGGVMEIASHFRFDNLVHMLIKLLACSLSSMLDTRCTIAEKRKKVYTWKRMWKETRVWQKKAHSKNDFFNKYLWNDCVTVTRIIKPILVAMWWQSCRVYIQNFLSTFFFLTRESPSNYHFN